MATRSAAPIHLDIPPVSSLRERVALDGMASLSDAELASLVLGDPPDRAAAALASVGGLEGLSRAGPCRVARVVGVGRARALRLVACVELGARIQRRLATPRQPLSTSQAVADLLTPRIGRLDHEEMWVLSLDGRTRLRAMRQVARGGRHGLVVTAREVLAIALGDAASGFILAHNHPSGSPEPSAADVAMTRSVADAAAIVGVPLLDHVIVTAHGEHRSLLDLGFVTGREGPTSCAEDA